MFEAALEQASPVILLCRHSPSQPCSPPAISNLPSREPCLCRALKPAQGNGDRELTPTVCAILGAAWEQPGRSGTQPSLDISRGKRCKGRERVTTRGWEREGQHLYTALMAGESVCLSVLSLQKQEGSGEIPVCWERSGTR